MTMHELSERGLAVPVELQHAIDGALRRLFDIVCASLAMLLVAPVALIVTLAILIEGGRPILFSQLRLGRNGRPFRMYKFRKFRPDCDDRGCPLTLDGDCRMTRIGRILAAAKLDELPQIWNVLRGDMSLVGPRPESLAFADCFSNGFEKIH
jgi:lipopolysaccharide/colanic/teichoic acid biosynthesis glycosyltransferase